MYILLHFLGLLAENKAKKGSWKHVFSTYRLWKNFKERKKCLSEKRRNNKAIYVITCYYMLIMLLLFMFNFFFFFACRIGSGGRHGPKITSSTAEEWTQTETGK